MREYRWNTSSRSVILFILWMTSTSRGWAQRSPFSLQAAVDELHRQEYPLNAPPGQQPRFMAGAFGSSPDQDYWDEGNYYLVRTHFECLQNYLLIL